MPLTDRELKALKPRDKAYKLADEKGLYIEVTPTGSKKSDTQHYHVTFMVDGNKHQHPSLLIDMAKIYWEDRDIGTLFVPKQCYGLLRRGDEKGFLSILEHLSYLAKAFSKGNKTKTTNDYEGSRIKPRKDIFKA